MTSRPTVFSGKPVEGRLDLYVNNEEERKRICDLIPKEWNADVSLAHSILTIRFSCSLELARARSVSFMDTLKEHNLPKPPGRTKLEETAEGSDAE